MRNFEKIWAERYSNYPYEKPNFLNIDIAIARLQKLGEALTYLSNKYIQLRTEYYQLLTCNSINVKCALVKTRFCLNLLEREKNDQTLIDRSHFDAINVIIFLENIEYLLNQLNKDICTFGPFISYQAQQELAQFMNHI